MVRAVAALGVCLLLWAAPALADSVFAGEWKVAIDLPDESMTLDLRVDSTSGAAVASWHRDPAVRLSMQSGDSAAHVEQSADGAYAISCDIAGHEAVLTGTLVPGHSQRGEVRVDGRTGAFRMYQLADMPPDYESTFVGSYQFPGGRTVVVTWNEHGHLRVAEIGERPQMFFDLQPMSQNTFAPAADLRSVGGPANWVVFTRDRDRRVDGLAIRTSDGGTAHAQRIELFRQERVTVPSDDVFLSGTLLTPLTAGPHPGVVLVHGAEVTHRTELIPEAVEMVQKGLAVLIYDLRGHAASGGEPPTMVEMGGDALSALTFMQSLNGVSTTEGGLLLAQKHLETDAADR